jgi:hypothetical protein
MLQRGTLINGTRSKLCSNDRNVQVKICFWFGGRGRRKRLGLNDRICPRRPYSNSMRSTEEGSVDDVIRQRGAKCHVPGPSGKGMPVLVFLKYN